jgi:hypothetical protein
MDDNLTAQDWRVPMGAGFGPRLCTVGHAAVDHCFDIAEFPERPTKTPAHRYRMISGGMASNASIAAARLGARVRLHGAVGDDEAGAFLADRLRRNGVDCTWLQHVAGASSSISAVVIDAHGERQIFNSRGNAIANAGPIDTRGLHPKGRHELRPARAGAPQPVHAPLTQGDNRHFGAGVQGEPQCIGDGQAWRKGDQPRLGEHRPVRQPAERAQVILW